LDLEDGRDTGVLEEMRVLTLLACVSNHSSKAEDEQTGGGGGGIKEGRTGRILDQSVFDQLGEGGGSLNLGDSSVISTGTWPEPVEGRGVSQWENEGKSGPLAKARSRSEGLALYAKGKHVYNPGWLRRE